VVLAAVAALATPAHAAKAPEITSCRSAAAGAAPTTVTVTFTGGASGQHYNLRWTDPGGSSYATLFQIGPDYTGTGQTSFTANLSGAYSVSITSSAPQGGKTYARCPLSVA
jgi:hypothetical protein